MTVLPRAWTLRAFPLALAAYTATGRASGCQSAKAFAEVKAGIAVRPSAAFRVTNAMSEALARETRAMEVLGPPLAQSDPR